MPRNRVQKPFYECFSIHLYIDQGQGCTRFGGSTGELVHSIQCGCPCSLVAKNNRGQIKRFKYSSPNDFNMARATILGNGFGISSSDRQMVDMYFYKI
jgi:hypothetical protein